MKSILAAALVVLLPAGAAAERAASPADATVFIRLVGSVHVDIDEVGLKRSFDQDHVEIATGSGFVISPYGYVITNDHVIRNTEHLLTNGITKAKVTLKVSRIDVCFPPTVQAARNMPSGCSEAAVQSSDPDVDLAVLFINGSNLPYIAFGDSDVVRQSQQIEAIGYPYGKELEVGRDSTAADLVPEVSTTPGAISALRAGDSGERRYLQVTSVVNPGNSGGPVVDKDGFALGVIRMRLTRAPGIAFAIPINEVKDFLESHGLDQMLPSRRLRLGPLQSLEGKGLGLRLPQGLADASPFRVRVEGEPPSTDIVLRIDRVLSPWSPKQIEQALVGTQAFEPVAITASESQMAPRQGTPLLVGHSAGTSTNGNQEVWVDYGVLDLQAEKLVARYIGPIQQIAFNAGVLRESLVSLAGQRMVAGEPSPPQTLEWSTTTAAPGQRGIPLPVGWVIEPGAPAPCAGIPQPPSAVATASPAQDFTVVMRAAVWYGGELIPDQAAAACSSQRGSSGASSYASRADWLGVPYAIEGAFTRLGGRDVVRLEVMAPAAKSAYARALLAAWIAKAMEQ